MERIGSEDVGTERALPFHGLLRPVPGRPRADDVPPAGASVRPSAHERLALLRRLHVERRAHALLAPADPVGAGPPRAPAPLVSPALVGAASHAPLASLVLAPAAVRRAAARG